jgi:hypothetical protein
VSHGARIGIRVSHRAILHRLPAILPPGAAITSVEPLDIVYTLSPGDLYRGSVSLSSRSTIDEALRVLESDLHFQVAQHARTALFVHAGVVGWKGGAILIPGRSLSGKTSLVAALVRAGAAYYSDEYAVIDRQGCVHPYAKPLSIRDENGGAARVPVAEIGGRAGAETLRPVAIVLANYRLGARWRPRALTQGQALLALIDNTVLAQEQPELTMETLTRVVSSATALQGLRGESGPTARQLLRWLDRDSPSQPNTL